MNDASSLDGFQHYLSQLGDHAPVDAATERRLARRWKKRGDIEAAQRLVCANLRFVVKIANQYRHYGIRVEDLVEEGTLGLLEAVRRFDPDRGFRFMTYAAYWVRAYILVHVLKQRTLVGVGTGPLQSRMFFRLARERARLRAVFGDDADLDQRLALTFGTTAERVREIGARIEQRDVSLDVPLFEDGGATAMELLVDESPDVEERFFGTERERLVRARIAEALKDLGERERYIVERRLLADEAVTLADLGKQLGISRERVRQIEERVKGKLQRALADLADVTDPESLTEESRPVPVAA